MKKSLILVGLMALMGAVVGQTRENVARECVLFELFTGVNCPYCPAAANGVAQMLEENLAIAPVAYHTNAFSTVAYYTAETNARASFYGITGYPTLKADGILQYASGGNASQTNYSPFLSRYNQRISVSSPFTIELTCQPSSEGTYDIHCVVNQVGDCTGTNLKVMMALTQCNIDVNWQGMHGLHHVCRDLIPTQTGTQFTGPSMTIDQSITFSWPKEDCYLTAWVQDFTTKEVFQAVRMSLNFDLNYDLVLKSVEQYAEANCSGMIQPLITVKNYGNETVQSFTIRAFANGTEVHSQNWTGSLPSGESVEIMMDEFDMGSGNQLTLKVVDPNGFEDGCMADNIMSITLAEPATINGYVKMQFKTDVNPDQTTVEVENMATGEIIREFHFELPKHMYTETFYLPSEGCYRIKVKDTAGDGLTGNSVFAFVDQSNQAIFVGGASYPFKYETVAEIHCDGTVTAVEESQTADCQLYPNPNQGKFQLELGSGTWDVEVYDASGRMVQRQQQFTGGELSLEGLGSGVFFLKANNGLETLVRKVMVY